MDYTTQGKRFTRLLSEHLKGKEMVLKPSKKYASGIEYSDYWRLRLGTDRVVGQQKRYYKDVESLVMGMYIKERVLEKTTYELLGVEADLLEIRYGSRMVKDIAWQVHHGRIPFGMVVVNKNGDITDCRVENLELVDELDFYADDWDDDTSLDVSGSNRKKAEIKKEVVVERKPHKYKWSDSFTSPSGKKYFRGRIQINGVRMTRYFSVEKLGISEANYQAYHFAHKNKFAKKN